MPLIPDTLTVCLAPDGDTAAAEQLADRLSLPITRQFPTEENRLILQYDADGLCFTDGKLSLRGDFTRLLPRLKQSNLSHEFLVKAAKCKDVAAPTLLDATAGLGEDSLLLAASGFRVRLYEYDPIVAALLEDSMKRAAKIPEFAEIVARMTLYCEDSIAAMQNPSIESPDVILLDPMFPERQKTALVKKKFQLIHKLERPCENEEALLNAAIAAKPRKIVIKRPPKAAPLAGCRPSYIIEGKSVRYDCLVL